jgi:hypothetical protein
MRSGTAARGGIMAGRERARRGGRHARGEAAVRERHAGHASWATGLDEARLSSRWAIAAGLLGRCSGGAEQ